MKLTPERRLLLLATFLLVIFGMAIPVSSGHSARTYALRPLVGLRLRALDVKQLELSRQAALSPDAARSSVAMVSKIDAGVAKGALFEAEARKCAQWVGYFACSWSRFDNAQSSAFDEYWNALHA